MNTIVEISTTEIIVGHSCLARTKRKNEMMMFQCFFFSLGEKVNRENTQGKFIDRSQVFDRRLQIQTHCILKHLTINETIFLEQNERRTKQKL